MPITQSSIASNVISGATGPTGPSGANGTNGATGATGGTPWTISGANTYFTGGNVGVNNTSPGVLTNTTQVAVKANVNGDSMFVAQNSNGLTTAKFGFQYSGGIDQPVIGSYSNHPLVFLTNDTERMRIDSAGRVTTPAQPAFDAYGTVGNVLFTTETPLPLNSTTFNVGSHYNTTTYRFTAPVAGMYFFRAQIYKQGSGNASRLRLYKNAADARVYQYSDATGTFTHNITGIISLAVNDYVTCTFNSDGAGTNIYLADNHTNFSGYLLG